MVGNGKQLACQKQCLGISVEFGNTTFLIDYYILPIRGAEVVLGVEWLKFLMDKYYYRDWQKILWNRFHQSIEAYANNKFHLEFYHLQMSTIKTSHDISTLHISSTILHLIEQYMFLFNEPQSYCHLVIPIILYTWTWMLVLSTSSLLVPTLSKKLNRKASYWYVVYMCYPSKYKFISSSFGEEKGW